MRYATTTTPREPPAHYSTRTIAHAPHKHTFTPQTVSPISSIDSNVTQERSSIIKIAHTRGELELTPDHVLLVDGEWAAARTVKVFVALSRSMRPF